MDNVVRVSKHLIPVERIALVEPFVASSGEPLKTTKTFKTRIVLRDRISVLSEEAPDALAKTHNFRWIEADGIGVNPLLTFRVELFAPTESFKPSKQFLSRMAWNDEEGNTQSKLMLTAPDALLALVARGQGTTNGSAAAPKPTRRRARRAPSAQTPARDPA